MLLLTLAAFSQAATTDTDTRGDLMRCAAATLAAPAADMSEKVPAAWYVVAAMRADLRPGIFYRRFADLTAEAAAEAPRYREGGALAGRAEAVRSDCDRRFPQARSRDAVHLPDDPAERNLLCYNMVVFLRALGPHEEVPSSPARLRLLQAEQRLEGQLPGGPDLIRHSDELMKASAEIGNAAAVGETCIAGLGDLAANP